MSQPRYVLERETPTVSGLQIGALVLLLAVGSGAAVFVGVGLVAVACHWPVAVPCAVAGVAVLVSWWMLMARIDAMLTIRETVEPVDASLPAVRDTVSIEVSQPERGRLAYLELPGGEAALSELARGLMVGRTFAESEWTGAGRPYSRATFRELRGELLERGLLEWRNSEAPAQGVQLTRVGRAVFSRIAEVPRTHAHARTAGDIAMLEAGEQGR